MTTKWKLTHTNTNSVGSSSTMQKFFYCKSLIVIFFRFIVVPWEKIQIRQTQYTMHI